MAHRRQLAWLVAAMLMAAACGGGDSTSANGIEIVVTTTVLGDIVAQIVGSDASVEVLMPTGADPHEFQASAQQAASIHKADLVVAIGLSLEEGLNQVLSSAVDDGVRILNIGPSVDPLPLGTDPDSLDPHVWLDPLRMMTAVDVIVTELELLEPSIDWSTSGDSYKKELALLDWELQALLGTISIGSRMLVTNHDSLGYFANRYGFQMVGVVVPGGSTLVDPSSGELAALVDVIEEKEITVIFAETTEPTVLARAVGNEVGWSVETVELYTSSLGPPDSGAETYLGMLRINADLMVSALG